MNTENIVFGDINALKDIFNREYMPTIQTIKTPTEEESKLGKILWNYFQLGHKMMEVDVIVGLGSIDMLPAERAADLYLDGWSREPYLVFSGGAGGRFSEKTPEKFINKTEGEQLALTAMECGVPAEQILVEKESKHTRANAIMTLDMLATVGIKPKRIMSVHMPSAERRDYGTWKKVIPETEIVIASPRVSYESYHERGFQGQFTHYDIISTLVGNIHRTILVYPRKGDMIMQKITPDAREAYHGLIELGYKEHLERSALDDWQIPDNLVGDDRELLSK